MFFPEFWLTEAKACCDPGCFAGPPHMVAAGCRKSSLHRDTQISAKNRIKHPAFKLEHQKTLQALKRADLIGPLTAFTINGGRERETVRCDLVD